MTTNEPNFLKELPDQFNLSLPYNSNPFDDTETSTFNSTNSKTQQANRKIPTCCWNKLLQQKSGAESRVGTLYMPLPIC